MKDKDREISEEIFDYPSLLVTLAIELNAARKRLAKKLSELEKEVSLDDAEARSEKEKTLTKLISKINVQLEKIKIKLTPLTPVPASLAINPAAVQTAEAEKAPATPISAREYNEICMDSVGIFWQVEKDKLQLKKGYRPQLNQDCQSIMAHRHVGRAVFLCAVKVLFVCLPAVILTGGLGLFGLISDNVRDWIKGQSDTKKIMGEIVTRIRDKKMIPEPQAEEPLLDGEKKQKQEQEKKDGYEKEVVEFRVVFRARCQDCIVKLMGLAGKQPSAEEIDSLLKSRISYLSAVRNKFRKEHSKTGFYDEKKPDAIDIIFNEYFNDMQGFVRTYKEKLPQPAIQQPQVAPETKMDEQVLLLTDEDSAQATAASESERLVAPPPSALDPYKKMVLSSYIEALFRESEKEAPRFLWMCGSLSGKIGHFNRVLSQYLETAPSKIEGKLNPWHELLSSIGVSDFTDWLGSRNLVPIVDKLAEHLKECDLEELINWMNAQLLEMSPDSERVGYLQKSLLAGLEKKVSSLNHFRLSDSGGAPNPVVHVNEYGEFQADPRMFLLVSEYEDLLLKVKAAFCGRDSHDVLEFLRKLPMLVCKRIETLNVAYDKSDKSKTWSEFFLEPGRLSPDKGNRYDAFVDFAVQQWAIAYKGCERDRIEFLPSFIKVAPQIFAEVGGTVHSTKAKRSDMQDKALKEFLDSDSPIEDVATFTNKFKLAVLEMVRERDPDRSKLISRRCHVLLRQLRKREIGSDLDTVAYGVLLRTLIASTGVVNQAMQRILAFQQKPSDPVAKEGISIYGIDGISGINSLVINELDPERTQDMFGYLKRIVADVRETRFPEFEGYISRCNDLGLKEKALQIKEETESLLASFDLEKLVSGFTESMETEFDVAFANIDEALAKFIRCYYDLRPLDETSGLRAKIEAAELKNGWLDEGIEEYKKIMGDYESGGATGKETLKKMQKFEIKFHAGGGDLAVEINDAMPLLEGV